MRLTVFSFALALVLACVAAAAEDLTLSLHVDTADGGRLHVGRERRRASRRRSGARRSGRPRRPSQSGDRERAGAALPCRPLLRTAAARLGRFVAPDRAGRPENPPPRDRHRRAGAVSSPGAVRDRRGAGRTPARRRRPAASATGRPVTRPHRRRDGHGAGPAADNPLARGADGTIYAIAGERLHRIDPASGRATLVTAALEGPTSVAVSPSRRPLRGRVRGVAHPPRRSRHRGRDDGRRRRTRPAPRRRGRRRWNRLRR